MKKTVLLIALLISQLGLSQIALTSNGVPVSNGAVLAKSVIGYPAAEILFRIRNNGSTTTNVWGKCESLLNNNGSLFQFCFGDSCFGEVQAGVVYPNEGVVLAPNASNGNFDHFLNDNPGNGTYPLDFVFRFFQTNQSTPGGAEVGNSITVTYRYDPNLSIDEINQLQNSGVIIKSTVVANELTLDVLKGAAMTIYDLNGKAVHKTNLNYGIQSIDVSDLSSGVYVVSFTNDEGNSSTKKIIKK
jgi:hypothetical protein